MGSGQVPYVRQFGLVGGDEKVRLPDAAPGTEILGGDQVILRSGGVAFGHEIPHTGLYKATLHAWGEKAACLR